MSPKCPKMCFVLWILCVWIMFIILLSHFLSEITLNSKHLSVQIFIRGKKSDPSPLHPPEWPETKWFLIMLSQFRAGG